MKLRVRRHDDDVDNQYELIELFEEDEGRERREEDEWKLVHAKCKMKLQQNTTKEGCLQRSY